MPSFPGSVYSPAAKTTQQVIQAAFFNDPEAEITAMQQGWLQGTAPLNSSNSTVNSLVVSSRASFPGMERCLLRTATQQALASGVVVALNWETETADVGGLHSTTAGASSRVVIPAGSSGTYLCRLWVQFAANSSGNRELRITFDGNESASRLVQPAAISDITCMNLVACLPIDGDSTIVAFATQNSGSTGSVSDVLTSAFDVVRIY